MAFDSNKTELGQMESKLFIKHKCQCAFSLECSEPKPALNCSCLEQTNKKEWVEPILNIEIQLLLTSKSFAEDIVYR